MSHGKKLMYLWVLMVGLFASSPLCAESVNPKGPALIPSGVYRLDPDHSSLIFKIDHLGFSHYVGRFDKMEGTLQWVGDAPENSVLHVTLDTNSIDTNNTKLEEDLRGDHWLNVIRFPKATYQVKKIVVQGPGKGIIQGTLTFLNDTHNLDLDARLVGYGQNPLTHQFTVGFSATAEFYRSDFGLSNLVPMVGDKVMLEIEAEFDKEE